jgi:hypothetical protein
MFRVVFPPIIKSAFNCIYSICYLSHRYCYLPLSWKIPDTVDTVVCAPDEGWKYYPKHVEQFPDINKLCNVASCWTYIGILLGTHPILHISRIRVKIKLKTAEKILLQQTPNFVKIFQCVWSNRNSDRSASRHEEDAIIIKHIVCCKCL